MLNFQTYSIRDLQHFVHILNSAEQEGVGLIELRRLLHESIRLQAKKRGRDHSGYKRRKTRNSYKNCSELMCDGMMVPYVRTDIDGTRVRIEKCDKCQFSEIVGVI